MRQPRIPDPNEQVERSKHETEHRQRQQLGAAEAQRHGFDPRELLSKEWLDTVNDLDVDRDLPPESDKQWNIEKKMAAHSSKQLGMGNITREEYEKYILRDRGMRRLLNSSYRRRGGTGAKCKGRTMERMTQGEGQEMVVMSPDLSDQLDAAFEAKHMLRSGSIGGKRFKGSTEVQVVTRDDGGSVGSDDSGGLISRVTGGLFG